MQIREMQKLAMLRTMRPAVISVFNFSDFCSTEFFLPGMMTSGKLRPTLHNTASLFIWRRYIYLYELKQMRAKF